MPSELIYGINCKIPDLPPQEEILNWDKLKEEQLWQREELPDFFDKVQYTKAGDLILTEDADSLK